jgi:hypothetical protein
LALLFDGFGLFCWRSFASGALLPGDEVGVAGGGVIPGFRALTNVERDVPQKKENRKALEDFPVQGASDEYYYMT